LYRLDREKNSSLFGPFVSDKGEGFLILMAVLNVIGTFSFVTEGGAK